MLEKINTLEQLIRALNYGPGYDGYEDVFKSISFESSELDRYCFWNSKKYTRNCIINQSDYELFVLCWEKDQTSPIHNHSGQQGWVYIVEGQLTEEQYNISKMTSKISLFHSRIMNVREFSYINDTIGLHKIANSFNGRTVSLHLYFNTVKSRKVFDVGGKYTEENTPIYSLEGKIL